MPLQSSAGLLCARVVISQCGRPTRLAILKLKLLFLVLEFERETRFQATALMRNPSLGIVR